MDRYPVGLPDVQTAVYLPRIVNKDPCAHKNWRPVGPLTSVGSPKVPSSQPSGAHAFETSQGVGYSLVRVSLRSSRAGGYINQGCHTTYPKHVGVFSVSPLCVSTTISARRLSLPKPNPVKPHQFGIPAGWCDGVSRCSEVWDAPRYEPRSNLNPYYTVPLRCK